GLQVEDLELHPALSELAAHAGELGQEPPLAHVDAEGDPRHVLARALPELDEAGNQRHRQVVDAVEAEVFEPADGGALAGAREPRHHDHPQARAHRYPSLALIDILRSRSWVSFARAHDRR